MLNKNDQYIHTLLSYIEKTLGLTADIKKWIGEENLPLMLREMYSFYVLRISESDCLIFIDKTENGNTPAVISRHCRMLNQYWAGGIIYSKYSLVSRDRARLIQGKIPFIIPGKQLYLPFLGMDLKEFFPSEHKKSEQLSPSAQLLVLGTLYNKEWIEESPSRMSKKIGVTNMSIGRAFKELELHDIASVRTSGKEKKLEFHVKGKELWNSTLDFLRSPITSSERVPYQDNDYMVLAGESALSHYSMIAEPNTIIYAVSNRTKKRMLTSDKQGENPLRDMIIQKWSYNPHIFSRKGIADPLSVYLELRDSEDERIEEALEEMMKGFTW